MRRRDRIRIRRHDNPWTRLIFGLTILACGVVFWLDHLGRLDAHAYLEWWPVAAIALGVAHFPRRQWIAGAFWIAIGVVFLLPLLGYESISVLRILGFTPLIFSAAGVALIVHALRPRAADANVHAVAVMGGNVRRLGAVEFSGGDAIAVMGGCEVDLSAAKLTREAFLDVLAFWGGIEIRVPRGWRVESDAIAILGGITDSTDEMPESAPRLVIRGSIIMGGMEVKQVEPAA